ncbi:MULTISPECIES: hypothetical protein [Bacillus amyloliquefaciens group]|uniref:hypothetical protein n=1 Tax=Bacillus amyloliquefaciens group TaxID=1938374 RepID=UPI000EFC2ACA|nr:hypothetical protein [Bacillus velezensis]TWO88859.1 hypothetical protein EUA42_09620 [Bacillus velezensis]
MKNDQKITLNSSFALSTLIVLLIALYPSYSSWFVTIFFLGFALIYTFEKKSKSSKLIASACHIKILSFHAALFLGLNFLKFKLRF